MVSIADSLDICIDYAVCAKSLFVFARCDSIGDLRSSRIQSTTEPPMLQPTVLGPWLRTNIRPPRRELSRDSSK